MSTNVWMLCLTLLVLQANGQEEKNMIGVGRYIVPGGKTECTNGAWYQDVSKRKLRVDLGKYTVYIDDAFLTSFANKTSNKLECDKKNWRNYDFISNKLKHMHELGIFKFLKPHYGIQEATTGELPLLKKHVNRTVIKWINTQSHQFSGVDFLDDKVGFSRLWFDRIDVESAPRPRVFLLNGCKEPLPPSTASPVNCDQMLRPNETTFSLASKSLVGDGSFSLFDDDDLTKEIMMSARVRISQASQRLAFVLGDPDRKNDLEQFGSAFWCNMTGCHVLLPGNGGCQWNARMTFTDVVGRLYSSQFLKWIGTVNILDYKPAVAKGTIVNMYQGFSPIGNKGVQMIVMIDKKLGVYRGEAVLHTNKPSSRVWLETLEVADPTEESLMPHLSCTEKGPTAEKTPMGLQPNLEESTSHGMVVRSTLSTIFAVLSLFYCMQ